MTAPAVPQARSLPGICQAARQVNCGECWQVPGTACTPEGDHVARFGRAMRRGLISGPDLLAVLGTLDAFTTATVICDEHGGEFAARHRIEIEPAPPERSRRRDTHGTDATNEQEP
jgi:hypothetical protein